MLEKEIGDSPVRRGSVMLKIFSGGCKFVTRTIVRFIIFSKLIVFIEDPNCGEEFIKDFIAIVVEPLLFTAESRGRMRIFGEICPSLGEE